MTQPSARNRSTERGYREWQTRSSLLEFRNISTNYPLLTGFFVIFWLSSFCYFLNAIVQNQRKIGLLVGSTVGMLLTKDFRSLLTAVFGIAGITFLPVLLNSFLSLHGSISSAAFALSEWMLLLVIPWCLYRGIHFSFTFMQSGILCMISISHFMKLHSFRTFREGMCLDEPGIVQENVVMGAVAANQDKSKVPVKNNHPIGHKKDRMGRLKTFVKYYFAPTFCFHPAYPKTDTFRLLFAAEKSLMFVGCCFLAYILIEHCVVPICGQRHSTGLVDSLLQLIVPMFFVNLLLFFGLFEGLCNVLAECTYFADREFYSDWWNCTDFGEFSRKWNKIVYAFLFRHIYRPLRADLGYPKWVSLFGTFLFSSLLHELVMGAFSGKMNFRFFAFQMAQIPLITLFAIPQLKLQGVLGNVVVLGGLFAGPPLLLLLYLD